MITKVDITKNSIGDWDILCYGSDSLCWLKLSQNSWMSQEAAIAATLHHAHYHHRGNTLFLEISPAVDEPPFVDHRKGRHSV